MWMVLTKTGMGTINIMKIEMQLSCEECDHSDTEHNKETIYCNETVIMPCGHDDYYDVDLGERIHNFCKCTGFLKNGVKVKITGKIYPSCKYEGEYEIK